MVRLVGSPAVMARQIQHLIDVAELQNVVMQFVPFTAGLHPGMRGPFEIVQFDDTPDENVVFLEGPRGDFLSDDPRETQSVKKLSRRIAEDSLSPWISRSSSRDCAGDG